MQIIKRMHHNTHGVLKAFPVTSQKGHVILLKDDDEWQWGVGVTAEFDGRLERALRDYAAALGRATTGEDLAGLLATLDSPAWAAADEQLLADWRRVMSTVIAKAGLRQNKELGAGAFLLDNPYTVAWLSQQGSELVRYISDGARDSLRQAIYEGVASNLTAREIAKTIQEDNLVGLLPQQIQSLYEQRVAWVEAGYTAAAVEEMATATAAEMLKTRAENIARTEVMRGINEGTQDSWMVARSNGLILPESRRVWISSPGDGRTCPICAGFHHKEATLDGVFTSAGGMESHGPPAHPRCRCAMGLRTPTEKSAPVVPLFTAAPLRLWLPWDARREVAA